MLHNDDLNTIFIVPMTRIFYYLVRKNFQNDEECRLFCLDSTLGCRVIQDLDLCKLDECDITKGTQSGAKSQKMNICANTKTIGLKFCRVDVQQLHILIVVMMSP